MLKILDKSKGGIDMNLLGFRSPDRIYYLGSCPAGLGGYSNQGFVWRFRIPDNLLFRMSNNLLEFLVAIITPWIDIIGRRLSPGYCALLMTDSTTTEGWMKKMNFREAGNNPIQASTRVDTARKYAQVFLDADVKGYSQWFAGKRNNVAGALSREWQRTNKNLTSILCSLFSNQMPNHFILQIPSKISCWLMSLLQQLPVSERLREEHMMAKLEHGNIGQHTASPLDAQTFSWINSHKMNKFPCLVHLQWLSEKDNFRGITKRCWLKEQSGVPSHMWCRPSGQWEDRIPQNDRELSILLSRQYRTYEAPHQKQQKALPFIVLNKLAKRQVTELDIALGELTIGAAFFACCSCKYSTVPKREERLTKLLCLQNSRFFKGGHLIPVPSADLESADSVAITFEMQKNDSKFDTVIYGRTDNPVLCPVLQWA
jgi:hypothetical protein